MGGRKINFEKGIKVNNLTIIEPSEKRTAGGSVKWLCICDCGQECYVDSSRLKSGLAKSCGCLSKQALIDGREIYKVVDKTGRRYGRLVVLERDFEKEKHQKEYTENVSVIVENIQLFGQAILARTILAHKHAENVVQVMDKIKLEIYSNKIIFIL